MSWPSPKTELATPEDASTFTDHRQISSTLKLDESSSNATFMGMKPSKKTCAELEAILSNDPKLLEQKPKPAHLGATQFERFLLVLKQYPMHVFWTNVSCVIPVIAGTLPIVVGSTFANGMIADVPDVSARFNDFVWLGHTRSTSTLVAECFKAFVNNSMWWIIIATVFYCLFSPSVVTKPVLCFVAPGWLFQMATNVHNNVGRAHGENVAGIRVIMLFTTILVLVCVVVCTAWMVGKRVNDPTLRWKVFFFIVLPPVLTYTIYELLLWESIPEMSDWGKLIIVAFVNPLCFEVSLFMARLVVRTIASNHEASGATVAAIAMSFKKCIGRYICFLIMDPLVATLASIILSLTEVFWQTSAYVRDVAAYYTITRWSTDTHHDVHALMKHKRNTLLRIRCAHNETVLELSFTTTALILLIAFRVSLDEKTPGKLPDVADLFGKYVVQWTSEHVADFVVVAWLTVKARQPVIATAHKLYRGWTLVMCAFTVFGNGYLISNVLPHTYAHIAGSDVQWMMMTSNVTAQLFNGSRLCQMYPHQHSRACLDPTYTD